MTGWSHAGTVGGWGGAVWVGPASGILTKDLEGRVGGDAATGKPTGAEGEGGDGGDGGEGGEEGWVEGDFEHPETESGGGGEGEHDAGGGGEQAEGGVFDEEDAEDLGAGGAEHAEEDGFAHALPAAADDGCGEHEEAGGDGEESHETEGESDAAEDLVEGAEHEGEIDDGDVGEAVGDGALELGGFGGGFDAGDEHVEGGGIVEGAEGEEDEEIRLDPAPVDTAEAGDLGSEGDALDVPDDFVAEGDTEFLGDPGFPGDGDGFGVGVGFGDPGAGDEGFGVAEVVGEGGAEFASEDPASIALVVIAEEAFDGAATDGIEAHGDDGSLVEEGEMLVVEELG